MKSTDKEIQRLTCQRAEWEIAITVLAAKHEAAAATAEQCAQELTALRAQYHAATQQLQLLQTQDKHLYRWENIGDGG